MSYFRKAMSVSVRKKTRNRPGNDFLTSHSGQQSERAPFSSCLLFVAYNSSRINIGGGISTNLVLKDNDQERHIRCSVVVLRPDGEQR